MDTTALPPLTGPSDYHITTAETDRLSMLDQISREITARTADVPSALAAEMVALFHEVALRHTDATWWLNNNHAHSLTQVLAREFTDEDKARHTEIRTRR
jgi:hypothetical protein